MVLMRDKYAIYTDGVSRLLDQTSAHSDVVKLGRSSEAVTTNAAPLAGVLLRLGPGPSGNKDRFLVFEWSRCQFNRDAAYMS